MANCVSARMLHKVPFADLTAMNYRDCRATTVGVTRDVVAAG